MLSNRIPHHLANRFFGWFSRTDTFGVVQLEAPACGVPVAAYPITGPRDVIGSNPVGALDEDLKSACLKALTTSRAACRARQNASVEAPEPRQAAERYFNMTAADVKSAFAKHIDPSRFVQVVRGPAPK